jgi:hypothetical protein
MHMKKDKKKKLEETLIQDYQRWNDLYEVGGSDPYYEDGRNLNLIRNQIMADKAQLKKLQYFPEVYHWELPPEMSDTFMVRGKEIRKNAKKNLEIYESDENYHYLQAHKKDLTVQQKQESRITAVTGSVDALIIFIIADDLVGMRRYETMNLQEEFAECRKEVEKLMTEEESEEPEKLGQLSIFDFI